MEFFNGFKIDEKSVMMQQARSNNKVLEHLMQKKIKGEIPGVLGRLVRMRFYLEFPKSLRNVRYQMQI